MKLTGALLVVLCLIALAPAQNIAQVYAFPCTLYTPCPSGSNPDSVIQASDGNLFGLTLSTTPTHGLNSFGGGGALFEVSPSTGHFKLLYTFTQDTKTGFFDNGSQPKSLIEGPDGFLYGVANGGTNSASAGLLFKVDKTGRGFQVIQSYSTSSTTGAFPNNIVVGQDGNLYGTTGYGGVFPSGYCQDVGCGVVFRLTTSGVYTVLHAFAGPQTKEGSLPLGVIQASDGNLYGVEGETNPATIFRVNPASGQLTTLYTFPAGTFALTRLTQAPNGLLYGLSRTSTSANLTLFSSTLTGVVHNLQQINCTQTVKLTNLFTYELLSASDGNLWGVCSAGGGSTFGVVFSVTAGGTLVQTIPFNGTDGAYPVVGLVQAIDGTLYGTAYDQGTSHGKEAFGNIYMIQGLPPLH